MEEERDRVFGKSCENCAFKGHLTGLGDGPWASTFPCTGCVRNPDFSDRWEREKEPTPREKLLKQMYNESLDAARKSKAHGHRHVL